MKTFEEYKAEILEKAESIRKEHPELRLGQVIYNHLHELYKCGLNSFSKVFDLNIDDLDIDPFYDDSKIDSFLEFIYENFVKQENSGEKPERELLVLRIQTPDGTILTSRRLHDFQSHVDKNGEEYFIDGGGIYYVRQSVNTIPAKDISIYVDSPFEEIRENLTRVSSKTGEEVKLKDMDIDWLYAILEYNIRMGIGNNNKYALQYMREIVYRNGGLK